MSGAVLPLVARPAAPLRLAPSGRVAWWLCLASLCGLVLQTRLGTAAMAVCLGAWVLQAAAYPVRALDALRGHLLPWLVPALAAASALWSVERGLSLHAGIELLVFTAAALIAARAVPARGFVGAFLVALLVGTVGSVLFGGRAVIGTTGENALIGLFGSKNNFASFLCLLLLASAAVLPDRGQPRVLRVLAVLGLLLAPALLVRTLSLGALLAGGMALAVLGGVLLLAAVPARHRPALLALLALLGAAVAVLAGLLIAGGESASQLLVAAGKDPSLTGRTYLWSRAAQYIAERPAFGLGYQAFWVQGHVEAEGLWRYAQIDTRAGFHFHNLYYETAVELGLLGVAALGLTLCLWFAAVLLWAVRRPGPESAFFAGLAAFYAMRLFVELDFLGPFSPGSFLLPLAWSYATRREPRKV